MFLLLFMLTASTVTQAGTVMLGVKGWYAQWDSAFDKAIAESFVQGLNDANPGDNWSSTAKPGSGFLAGPMLGYLTDDKDWSFSAAFMVLSSFKTSTDWEESTTPLAITTKTEMNRKDVDISISRVLNEYFKVYAGYKYITAKYKTELSGSPWFEVEMKNSIPTAGIAVATSIAEGLVAGVQGGVMYVMPEYKFEGEKVKTKDSVGLNIEPNLSYLATDNFMLQVGVRYQIYSVKFDDPANGWTGSKNDQFLGLTLAGIYLF